MSDPSGQPAATRALILTIHGTNDGVHGKPGDTKWWELTSGFVSQLKERLAARGLAADFEEFLWGGANSAFAREKGSIALVRRLRKHAKTYDEIHLIGHSHGGNVAVDAARRAAWGRGQGGRALRRRPPVGITSLTTVGTPFLRARARSSDYLYSFAFVLLMLVAVLAFAAGPAITLWNLARMAMAGAPAPPALQLILSGVSFAFLVISALMLGQRWSRFRWIARLMKRGARRANLLSIWHPKDEAIGGLKRTESFAPVLLPPGALWSGSHRLGAKLGSFAFVLSGLAMLGMIAALVLSAALPPGNWVQAQLDEAGIGGVPMQILLPTLSALGMLAGALAALALYASARILVGALPEFLLRGLLNTRGVGVLRAFAFGSDTGQPMGEVSERPHFYEGEVWIVPPALAEKMEAETLSTLTGFLARHRASLFGVTVDADWVREIGEDAATWDSLIHTTYFDHAEIADRIAAHIAGAHDTPD